MKGVRIYLAFIVLIVFVLVLMFSGVGQTLLLWGIGATIFFAPWIASFYYHQKIEKGLSRFFKHFTIVMSLMTVLGLLMYLYDYLDTTNGRYNHTSLLILLLGGGLMVLTFLAGGIYSWIMVVRESNKKL